MAEIKRFTLVELLVVIAIISILASLLLPSLKMANETAKGIKCGGNLKQSSLVHYSYANDYNGYIYVGQGSNTAPVTAWRGWMYKYFVEGYLPNPAISLCPTEKPYVSTKASPQYCGIYGFLDENPATCPWRVKLTNPAESYNMTQRVTFPSQRICNFDSYTSSGMQYWLPSTRPDLWGAGFALRHNSQGRASYYDGHCESVDKAKAVSGMNPASPPAGMTVFVGSYGSYTIR